MNQAYYGGEVRCEAEAGGEDLFDPQELICGACSDIFCAQICPKHGTDFLEYKVSLGKIKLLQLRNFQLYCGRLKS